MKRFDLVQVNSAYTTDHEMEPSDDGEWVRFEDVAAVTSHPQEAETPPWQPIETAPKMRTILVYGCEASRRIWGRAYYFKGVPGDGEGWIASSFYTEPKDDMRGSFTPTHWMPLPAPPVVKTP